MPVTIVRPWAGVVPPGGGGLPGNILEYGLEDGGGTNWGGFRNTCGLLPNQTSASCPIAWAIDTVDFPTLTGNGRSAKRLIPASNNNQGANSGLYIYSATPNNPLSTGYMGIYIRFAYKEDANADDAGTAGNKLIKCHADDIDHTLGFLVISADRFTMGFDSSQTYANSGWFHPNVPSSPFYNVTVSSLRGQWHWYEMYQNPQTGVQKLWIDDYLTIDAPIDQSSTWQLTTQSVELISEVDNTATTWYQHIDQIGFSTTKMGIPAMSSNP
jgi:hypothetical protein